MKKGFTLAEVLITLGIIGVVAALTIPALITSYQEKVTVTKLKKVYSMLSQAYLMAQQEHGETSGWFPADSDIPTDTKIFFNNLKPYLKITKDCGVNPGCLTPGYIKSLQGTNYVDYDNNPNEHRVILADGTAVFFFVSGANCKDGGGCGNIKIDIDGFKGPYTWGKDVFIVDIMSDRLLPAGTPDSDYKACNMTVTTSDNGTSCAAWVIYNENMDYLHCNDLSWTGKTKCK
jgi:prepilin-type N-terminal cleavage/methylation domain-containing protein